MAFLIALSIFARSPAAYHALKDIGMFQLPCDRTLRGYMSSCLPGIHTDMLLEQAEKYRLFKQKQIKDGLPMPTGEGVLMWDEVKV